MAKDYIEYKCGAKFPLNYTFDGVNNFVFSTDVMFEDLQALCLGLVAKLEAVEQGLHLTGITCPACQSERQVLLRCPKCGSIDAHS